MKTDTRQGGRRFPLLRAAVVMAGLLVMSPAAGAGSNWFDKGKDLLKSFGGSQSQGAIGVADMAAGLKEALRVGVGDVVGRLGRADGFNADPAVHIPLPDHWKQNDGRIFLPDAAMETIALPAAD